MSDRASGRYTPPSRGRRTRNAAMAIGAAIISSGISLGLEAGAASPKPPTVSSADFFACVNTGENEIVGVETQPFSPQFCSGQPGEVLTQITGPQGVQGAQGAQGAQGSQGVTGSQGAQGTQGTQGTQGEQGVNGNQGNQGSTGPQGSLGLQGSQGGQGTLGNQGVQGSVGAQGRQGAQGNQGTQGVQGSQGSQGAQGPLGSQGTQGSQGAQGDQGSQGSQGIQGAQGFQGPQGAQGAQGPQGAQGSQGAQGPVGAQGNQGNQGAQGLSSADSVYDTPILNVTLNANLKSVATLFLPAGNYVLVADVGLEDDSTSLTTVGCIMGTFPPNAGNTSVTTAIAPNQVWTSLSLNLPLTLASTTNVSVECSGNNAAETWTSLEPTYLTAFQVGALS
jgi:collagen triple helix repeat protein